MNQTSVNTHAIYTAASPEAQTYPCWKCGGSGQFSGGWRHGQCFQCGGKGHIRAKDPAKRAIELNKRAARDAAAAGNAQTWAEQHPAEHAALTADAKRGATAVSPRLTENQLAAVQRGMAKRTGRCSCCGRELTDPASIAAGIGPVCAKRFGFIR